MRRAAYLEFVPVRKDILCDLVLVHLGGRPFLLLLSGVLCDVCDCFLDEPYHLLLGARVEDIAALPEQRLQVFCDVSTGYVYAANAIGNCEALVYRNGVGHAITSVQNHARCPSASVQ